MTLLDLTAVGLRVSGFRFEVLDVDLLPAGPGFVHPVHSTAVIDHDTSRGIMRQLDGLIIDWDESSSVDFVRHRIRPWMDLSDGTRRPLGVYLFADATRVRSTAGTRVECTLVDQAMMLDQERGESTGAAGGFAVDAALFFLLLKLPRIAFAVQIETGSAVLGEPVAWPAETHILEQVNSLGSDYGYLPIGFDNNGVPHIRRAIDPANATATIDLDTLPRLFDAESVTESSDFLQGRSRWIVVDSSNQDVPLRGEIRLPFDHPLSEENRGYEVPRVINTQGLDSAGAAFVAAVNAAVTDSRPSETVEFDGPPDPRHDLFDVVTFEGKNWLERAWQLPMREGARMHHILTRNLTP